VTAGGRPHRSVDVNWSCPARLRLLGLHALAPVAAQMTPMWWFADYPAPSDFLQLLFSCNHRPTVNIPTRFCDPSLDRQMSQAVRLQTVDPTAAAARWAQVDHDLTDQAPWVPVFTPTTIDLVSNRVGNYQYNPYSWILLDQLWVR
jgi:peptide/nickel transport system substrate-binding protein